MEVHRVEKKERSKPESEYREKNDHKSLND